ncbi:hypothetical protein CgunFtcFv8_005197 [Champsocephalus gunnari]|uniref:Uncharacterized protein n=1 Tax=Champsocephalus gunnari TaxID=52237 RepID=A0AAN8CZU7_CHAGU|nr:hypothetical protein CgunFtcFv8_005197 [Champsocephalus gunnari]
MEPSTSWFLLFSSYQRPPSHLTRPAESAYRNHIRERAEGVTNHITSPDSLQWPCSLAPSLSGPPMKIHVLACGGKSNVIEKQPVGEAA